MKEFVAHVANAIAGIAYWSAVYLVETWQHFTS